MIILKRVLFDYQGSMHKLITICKQVIDRKVITLYVQ